MQTRKLIIALASEAEEWKHGYALSISTGVKSGSLYPILMRLEDRGLLESKWQPSPHPGRPARRMYRLTAQGNRVACGFDTFSAQAEIRKLGWAGA